jgi:methionyl-tRNA synthetase
MSEKKFYLTTPIYYVNARPHIGHAYSTIVADVLARRHRLLGEDTYFLTGTDEHGQKIERSAAAAGIPPQQFADQVSKTFSDLWKRMGITNDQFIRTTDEKHKTGVQKLFRELYDKGHIYLASYTGSYCVSDEAFVDAPVGTPCPDCGRLLEEVTEENFFFKLSAFQQSLIQLIESNDLVITPDSSRNEVLSFIKGGLKDLSISRSSFTWGIPVPDEIQKAAGTQQNHVVYVWLDALANYMTALGYGSDDETLFQKFWPADLHLVGKEITRFHCVYWPAFLLAAGLPLPKQITANGWLLFDNSKMSKSKGNVVRAETILDTFGTLCPPNPTDHQTSVILSEGAGLHPAPQSKDPEGAGPATTDETISTENPTKADRNLFAADVLRYYLLREIPFGQDGSFSFDSLITRYNADLANGYGNLVSRVLNMISQYFDGKLPDDEWLTHETFPIANSLVKEALTFEPQDLTKNVVTIVSYVGQLDAKITEIAPWKLAKSNEPNALGDLKAALYQAAESIRIITALLYPILPYATARVWQQLGLGDIEQAAKNGELTNLEWGGLKPGTKLGPLGPIFPRADKGLAQMMADNEEKLETRNSKLETESLTPSQDSTAPEAAPRTSSLPEPTGTLTVGGSTALTVGPAPAEPSTLDPEPSPFITIDDFAKIELRVAQIKLAERIPKADKLLRLEVDLGPFGQRQILSGIAEFYTPEELIGRRIVVITNLAPRKMRGLESHGMLLAASDGDHGKPHLATCGDEIALGSRLK